MLAKSSKDIQTPGSRQSQEAESGHPVIRTLYDHFEVIITNGGFNLVVYVCCCAIQLHYIYDCLKTINQLVLEAFLSITKFVFIVFY